jgi:hypothetical protein
MKDKTYGDEGGYICKYESTSTKFFITWWDFKFSPRWVWR